MTAVDLINIIVSFFPWGFIKLFTLLLIFIYLVFAAIIIRQETLMSQVVGIPPLSPALRIVAIAHMLAAVGMFFLALILL